MNSTDSVHSCRPAASSCNFSYRQISLWWQWWLCSPRSAATPSLAHCHFVSTRWHCSGTRPRLWGRHCSGRGWRCPIGSVLCGPPRSCAAPGNWIQAVGCHSGPLMPGQQRERCHLCLSTARRWTVLRLWNALSMSSGCFLPPSPRRNCWSMTHWCYCLKEREREMIKVKEITTDEAFKMCAK